MEEKPYLKIKLETIEHNKTEPIYRLQYKVNKNYSH